MSENSEKTQIEELRQADIPAFTESEHHKGKICDHRDGIGIMECETCGFRHVMPLPSPEELKQVYAQDYYKNEKPTYLKHAREDEEWANLAHRDRLDTFERVLGPIRRTLLDVGSGPGMFLKYADENGWSVCGVEPSAQAAAHTRDMGLKVIEDFFGPDMASEISPVDVINMNNMLEHVPNPGELIALAHDRLSDGGLLCLTVPNDYNPFQRALQEAEGFDSWWIAPKHHLNYFTFEGLSQFATRYGFNEVARLSSFPLEMFLLMGDNYIGNDSLGRQCHNKRKKFDMTLERANLGHVRRAFYRALGECGIGREAAIILQKTEGENS